MSRFYKPFPLFEPPTLHHSTLPLRSGRIQDEFKSASSQVICLKEAVNFTASAEAAIKVGVECVWGGTLRETSESTRRCSSAAPPQQGGASGLQRLQQDTRAQLQKLATTDYTGATLLQLKKQVRQRVGCEALNGGLKAGVTFPDLRLLCVNCCVACELLNDLLSRQALILDFIHYVDICDQLLSKQVASASDWTWRRQLRYYPQQEGRVAVSMAEAQFEYSWEYQVGRHV